MYLFKHWLRCCTANCLSLTEANRSSAHVWMLCGTGLRLYSSFTGFSKLGTHNNYCLSVQSISAYYAQGDETSFFPPAICPVRFFPCTYQWFSFLLQCAGARSAVLIRILFSLSQGWTPKGKIFFFSRPKYSKPGLFAFFELGLNSKKKKIKLVPT